MFIYNRAKTQPTNLSGTDGIHAVYKVPNVRINILDDPYEKQNYFYIELIWYFLDENGKEVLKKYVFKVERVLKGTPIGNLETFFDKEVPDTFKELKEEYPNIPDYDQKSVDDEIQKVIDELRNQ